MAKAQATLGVPPLGTLVLILPGITRQEALKMFDGRWTEETERAARRIAGKPRMVKIPAPVMCKLWNKMGGWKGAWQATLWAPVFDTQKQEVVITSELSLFLSYKTFYLRWRGEFVAYNNGTRPRLPAPKPKEAQEKTHFSLGESTQPVTVIIPDIHVPVGTTSQYLNAFWDKSGSMVFGSPDVNIAGHEVQHAVCEDIWPSHCVCGDFNHGALGNHDYHSPADMLDLSKGTDFASGSALSVPGKSNGGGIIDFIAVDEINRIRPGSGNGGREGALLKAMFEALKAKKRET